MSIEETIKNLNMFSEKTVENVLDDETKTLLNEYCRGGYIDISNYMLYPEKFNEYQRKFTIGRIKLLNKAIKLSRLPFPLVVYHGTNYHVIKENKVAIKTFASTSLDKDVAIGFAESYYSEGVVLELHIPTGYPGLWLYPYSQFKFENEILLRNGIVGDIIPANSEQKKHNFIKVKVK